MRSTRLGALADRVGAYSADRGRDFVIPVCDADRVGRDRIEPARMFAMVVVDSDRVVVDSADLGAESADPGVQSADPVVHSANPGVQLSPPVDVLCAPMLVPALRRGARSGMTDDLWTRPGFLRDFRDGKPAALTAVYKNYLSRTEAWARNGFPAGAGGGRVPGIKNPDDHADVVQEVYKRTLAAEKARLAYDGQGDYWLYHMAFVRNVVVDYHRRRRREVLFGGRDSSDPADVLAWAAAPEPDEPAHGYLEPRARAIVLEYVAGLRDPMRAVHQAIYVERSFQLDTAKQLGLSRRKVQKLIERMLREVRALLEQAGIRDSNVTQDPEGSSDG